MNDDPYKFMEQLIHQELEQNEDITVNTIDRSQITNRGNLHVDVMRQCQSIDIMSDYDLFANINYNAIRYLGYINTTRLAFAKGANVEENMKSFQLMCFDLFLTLRRPYAELPASHWENLRAFFFKMLSYDRNHNVAKYMHGTVFDTGMVDRVTKVIRKDLLEIVGYA